MRRSRVALLFIAGLWACGPPESPGPAEGTTAPVAATSAPPFEPASPSTSVTPSTTSEPPAIVQRSVPAKTLGTAATTRPRDATATMESHPDLSALLRLPPSAPEPRRAMPLEVLPTPAPQPAPKSAKKPGRIGVEYQARTDGSAVQPERARTQTDAGVSVDVTDRAKIKGGVRVEQENGKERERPTPTVGIEKRF